MPEFKYEGVTRDNQLQSGQIGAANAAEALMNLESQGLTIRSLHQVDLQESDSDLSTSPLSDQAINFHSTNAKDEHLLRNRIAVILEERDVLVPALEAFAEEMSPGRRRRELRKLVGQLRGGATIDEICQSKNLAATWLPLLGGGPPLGSGRFLNDVFTESSRENAARTQWARVIAYPLLVILIAIAVLVLLLVVIVPQFSSIFDDFQMELPSLTEFVVNVSDEIRFHPARISLVLAGCLAAAYAMVRVLTTWGLPGELFRTLTNGSSRQLTVMAAFLCRLSESLNIGLPLSTALRLAGQSTGKPGLRGETELLAQNLEAGIVDNKPPWASGLPASVVYALRAGAEGGLNIRLLHELSEIYAERVRNRTNWSTGFLPQFSILFLAGVVAIVVLALFLPLISLISGLTG